MYETIKTSTEIFGHVRTAYHWSLQTPFVSLSKANTHTHKRLVSFATSDKSKTHATNRLSRRADFLAFHNRNWTVLLKQNLPVYTVKVNLSSYEEQEWTKQLTLLEAMSDTER